MPLISTADSRTGPRSPLQTEIKIFPAERRRHLDGVRLLQQLFQATEGRAPTGPPAAPNGGVGTRGVNT